MKVIRFYSGICDHWLQVVLLDDGQFLSPTTKQSFESFDIAACREIDDYLDLINHDPDDWDTSQDCMDNAMTAWTAYRLENGIPDDTLQRDLGHTLVRFGPDEWQWIDGTPAPVVVDKRPADIYNFRTRQINGETFCEVLITIAHRDRDWLGWITEGAARRRYEQVQSSGRDEAGEDSVPATDATVSKRAIPIVALVPLKEWEERTKEKCIGAKWPPDRNDEILAKARSLGWDGQDHPW